MKEHDRVVLTAPVPAEGLEVGDVGTVVHVYPDGKAFDVEFTTLDGKTPSNPLRCSWNYGGRLPRRV
ncbi:MAG: DUF4926 domain-containing protein [Acidobacteria bacterium]|nr:MAG: DUF4926 domain-containing protein [Acidobacteriota bacterium]